MAIPFTGGASLALVPIGEGMMTAATAISVVDDVSKGNYGSAATSIVLDRGFGALGKIVKDAKGIETLTGRTILRATVFSSSKIAEKISEKFKTDNPQPKAVVKNMPNMKNTLWNYFKKPQPKPQPKAKPAPIKKKKSKT